MMDARRLAVAAHTRLIERLAEAQQRIIQHEQLIDRFGDHALPVSDMFRGQDALSTGQVTCQKVIDSSYKAIKELTPTILELEDLMSQANHQDMEAFAEFIRSRYGKHEEGDDHDDVVR